MYVHICVCVSLLMVERGGSDVRMLVDEGRGVVDLVVDDDVDVLCGAIPSASYTARISSTHGQRGTVIMSHGRRAGEWALLRRTFFVEWAATSLRVSCSDIVAAVVVERTGCRYGDVTNDRRQSRSVLGPSPFDRQIIMDRRWTSQD